MAKTHLFERPGVFTCGAPYSLTAAVGAEPTCARCRSLARFHGVTGHALRFLLAAQAAEAAKSLDAAKALDVIAKAAAGAWREAAEEEVNDAMERLDSAKAELAKATAAVEERS